MIKFYSRILYALSMACSYNAFAIENLYLRGDLGPLWSGTITNKQAFYQLSGKKRFKNGVASSIGLGYKINKNFRTELSYNRADNLKYRANDVPLVNIAGTSFANYKQNLKIQSIMANLYYDVPLHHICTPYLGAGFGYSNLRFGEASRFIATTRATRSYKAKNSHNFSYTLMAGLAMHINKKFAVDIGYRFQDFGKTKSFYSTVFRLGAVTISSVNPPASGPRIRTHSIMTGIRYSF